MLLGPRTNPVAEGCLVLLAPLTGSTGPVSAQLWVSLDDANGNPIALPAAGLASTLTASLLANAAPNQGAAQSYPLTLTGAPTTVGGRTWGQLTTGAAASLPQGGWLTVTVVDPTATLHVSSPSVAPVTLSADLAGGPTAHATAVTSGEQAATAGYATSVQTRPSSPPPTPSVK